MKQDKPEAPVSSESRFITGTGDDIVNNRSDVTNIAREIARKELVKEAKEIRKEFMTIFGLFAGFLTFTVLQIQSLIQETRMSLIMGACAFFTAVVLLFVLGLHHVVKEKASIRDFVSPMFFAVILLMFVSFQCFWYATHNGELWLLG